MMFGKSLSVPQSTDDHDVKASKPHQTMKNFFLAGCISNFPPVPYLMSMIRKPIKIHIMFRCQMQSVSLHRLRGDPCGAAGTGAFTSGGLGLGAQIFLDPNHSIKYHRRVQITMLTWLHVFLVGEFHGFFSISFGAQTLLGPCQQMPNNRALPPYAGTSSLGGTQRGPAWRHCTFAGSGGHRSGSGQLGADGLFGGEVSTCLGSFRCLPTKRSQIIDVHQQGMQTGRLE